MLTRLLLVCAVALIGLSTRTVSQPLSIMSVSPVPQTTSAGVAGHIVVEFDSAVNVATVTPTSFRVFGKWTGVVQGQVLFENGGRRIRFIPSAPLFAGDWVTVSLARTIATPGGRSLSHGYAWNFWTRTLPGTLALQEIARIPIRRPGEPRIQSYGAYGGDFDGDGYTDIAIPNELSNDVRLFLNDGAGMYSTFTVFPLPSGSVPSTNEGADFNGDGFVDLAVGNIGTDSVCVMLGDGQGGFTSLKNYRASQAIRGLTVLDFDGDGWTDIATANRVGNNISLLRNNGNGTFAAPVNLEAGGNQETAIVAADANGDGILDLFVGAYQSSQILLLLGDGNGGFTLSHAVTVTGRPWMIAAGDFNGDGHVDGVSANSSGNNLTLVFGNGQGQLSAPVTYPTGSFPLAIDVGDIDGDGDLDVMTSNYFGASWTLYENNGSGVLVNPRTFPASSAGSCATLHDRDNDGDLDVTGIDELDDLLFLFVNTGPTHTSEPDPLPDRTALLSNYPNPFNPSTIIRFEVGGSGFVLLRVYDLIGREVATLLNEQMEPGRYDVTWDASGRTSGVYLCRLQAGGTTSVRKLVLVR
jgi:hypothetical protein